MQSMELTDIAYIHELTEGRVGFEVTNDAKADWAVEKILEAYAERDRLLTIADERIRQMHEQKAEIVNKCANSTKFLTDSLYAYFQTVKPTVTKTQETYKLFSGKIVNKHQLPEYVRDEAAMLPWVKKNAPNFVQTKETIAWGELKKVTTTTGEKVVLTETGELIPGVVAKEREDVFVVEK